VIAKSITDDEVSDSILGRKRGTDRETTHGREGSEPSKKKLGALKGKDEEIFRRGWGAESKEAGTTTS